MKQPPIEYANMAHTMEAYRMLAEKTGLPVELVAEMMLTGESRQLFGGDGRLKPAAELRHLGGRRDPKQALDELRAKRYPPGPVTSSQARREVRRLRRPGYPK
jgi:hypothetical protein